MPKTIAVVLKRNAPEAVHAFQIAERCLPEARFVTPEDTWASHRGELTGVEPLSPKQLDVETDLALVFGGDGTIITAAALFLSRPVPMLGVNLGRLGFLTSVSHDELPSVLPRALAGELPFVDRMRLDVEVRRGHQVLLTGRVLNDAVMNPTGIARVAQYRVTLGGALVTSLRADGVIVATPTGSTAYSMAAGGSIVMPGLAAVAITPICPSGLSHRPIVVAPHGEVVVSLESDNEVFCSLDGHVGQALMRGDEMAVRRALVDTRILEVPWRPYFQMLRSKLRWGEG